MADDIAVIRSMNTEAINHEPAITFIQTGRQVAGQTLHRFVGWLMGWAA